MERSPQSRAGPPHNPGVRDLVESKRRWSSPPDPAEARRGFRGWHERGYLPHRDEPGLIQLVAFHLADSFPRALRAEWAALLEVENDRERRARLEAYLDRGRGECCLQLSHLGQLVESALRFHDGKHYELRAWVVMPNHVHVMFEVAQTPMAEVVASWKIYTARQANKSLSRRGQFWARDFWDTYVRNTAHEQRARRYVESNPVKAHLVCSPSDWPWTSARFRDPYGRLNA